MSAYYLSNDDALDRADLEREVATRMTRIIRESNMTEAIIIVQKLGKIDEATDDVLDSMLKTLVEDEDGIGFYS
jgi:hypothetical protein